MSQNICTKNKKEKRTKIYYNGVRI